MNTQHTILEPARPTRTTKPRRMARGPYADGADDAAVTPPAMFPPRSPSKLDRVEALLRAPAGASIAELMEATGWQQHSVRGAIAGALKKRGLIMRPRSTTAPAGTAQSGRHERE